MRLPHFDIPLPTGPISGEIADAAGELACRIELGEFDDLDETQVTELLGLASMMEKWARLAGAMEQSLNTVHAQPILNDRSVAFRN